MGDAVEERARAAQAALRAMDEVGELERVLQLAERFRAAALLSGRRGQLMTALSEVLAVEGAVSRRVEEAGGGVGGVGMEASAVFGVVERGGGEARKGLERALLRECRGWMCSLLLAAAWTSGVDGRGPAAWFGALGFEEGARDAVSGDAVSSHSTEGLLEGMGRVQRWAEGVVVPGPAEEDGGEGGGGEEARQVRGALLAMRRLVRDVIIALGDRMMSEG